MKNQEIELCCERGVIEIYIQCTLRYLHASVRSSADDPSSVTPELAGYRHFDIQIHNAIGAH